MKKLTCLFLLISFSFLSVTLQAAEYTLDTKGGHAFIQFKIKHLGYSWLIGRFNTFDGHFSYNDTSPETSKVTVNIDTASIDTNHAERDKHLRGKDFFEVKKFPTAEFVSTSFKDNGDGTAEMQAQLTLHGITKLVTLKVEHMGHGADPWGGYRRGFSASTALTLKDFGIDFDLGPASHQAELFISVEGIRK